MRTRTLFLISVILNVALAGGLAFLSQQTPVTSAAISTRVTGPDRVIVEQEEHSSASHYGPVYEALLPGAVLGRTELFDLEKGARLLEPPFESFNNDPKALSGWITSTGMDVSGIAGAELIPACVTYYMALVPCEKGAWQTTSAADVLGSPALASIKEPKRACLIAGDERCYMFRTLSGRSGILMLQDSGNSIRIKYKLVNPPSSESELLRTASN